MGTWAKYCRDDRGQTAVIFALALLPLIALTSAGVDYSQLTKERVKVASALDAAVLAAANNNAIEDAEKHLYAETIFTTNYGGDLKLDLTPSLENNAVRLSASGILELSFGKIVGINDLNVFETSAATIANENTICLLALNEDERESVLFDGGIEYSSPSCAVYSNSTHAAAITSRSAQMPEAKSFCAVGGVDGEFLPYGKGECQSVDDPYEATAAPDIPATCSTPLNELIILKDSSQGLGASSSEEDFQQRLAAAYATLNETGSLRSAITAFFNYETIPLYDADLNQNIEVSENKTGSFVDIIPGVFCGGLTVDGIDVDFLPGEYIMKDGPLSFINGAEATAEDVTFVLSGTGSVLNIQSESSLTLKAPSTGPRKGLAVMNAVDRSGPMNRTIAEKNSLIAEGGALQVTGTIYLPEQTLEILGKNTSVGSMAPATSFIADRLHISGGAGSRMNIAVDHVEAGVPPIQPRAEDGSRLID